MNRTAMMFLALSLAAGSPAEAAPQPKPATLSTSELASSVRRALAGYEPLEAGRDVRALVEGNGAAAVTDALLRLIRDPATPGILRLSAIEALGYAPTEAGRSYLHELVAKLGAAEDDRVFTLAAALRALGSFSATELSRLSPYLQHKNADVREAATLGLSRCGAPSSELLPLLQRRLAVESDSGVKETLRSTVASLSKTSPR
jgi:hypothetical protein